MSSLSPSATVIPSHFRTLTCPPSCLASGRIRAWTQAKSMDGMVFAQRPSGGQILQAQEEGNQGLKRGRGIRDEVKSRDLPCSWVWPHLLRAAWEPSWNHPSAFSAAGWMPSAYTVVDALWVDLPTFEEDCLRTVCLRSSAFSPPGGRFLTGTSSALGLDARFYGYDQYWWLLQCLAWSMASGCDNSRRLGSPYFSFIDEESDLMPGLSQFQAHGVNADQGGCELESSWRNVEDALGISARLCELRYTWAGPDRLLTGGTPCIHFFLLANSCISGHRLWAVFVCLSCFPLSCRVLESLPQQSWPASDKYHLITEQVFLPFFSARLLLPKIKLHCNTTELPF